MHKHHMALLIIVAATCTLAGCGTGNIAIRQQDLDFFKTPIQVVHTQTPNADLPSRIGGILYLVGTTVGAVTGVGAVAALPGTVVAGSTAATGAALNAHSPHIDTDCVVPDAGYDMSDRFINAWKRQGDAPKMVLIAQPIASDQKLSEPTITITITRFAIMPKGLYMPSRLEMKNAEGKLIFSGEISTYNDYYDKYPVHTKEELLADHCRLLSQIVDNLSQYSAERYVRVLRSELSRSR